MFKPNPKAQVLNKFKELFGTDHDVTVVGGRLTPAQCRSHGFPTDTFMTELHCGDEVVAAAHSRDWRHAYKLLRLEVEKLFTDGTQFA